MEIVNIVVSGSFNQKIDLQKLVKLDGAYTYDPELYHGGYIKLSKAKATIYNSGKYIISGIKEIPLIDELWRELVSFLSPYLDTVLFEKPSIKNIVAKDSLDMDIPLAKLQIVLSSDRTEYEPEVFPGLMWTTEYGSVNIFQNGKFMLLGCKTVNDLKSLDEFVQKRIKSILNNQKE